MNREELASLQEISELKSKICDFKSDHKKITDLQRNVSDLNEKKLNFEQKIEELTE